MEIEEIKNEYEKLLSQLSDPELISNPQEFDKLSKKKERLEKMIERKKEIEEIMNKIKENESIISAQEDPELVALAEAEIAQLKEKAKILEKELQREVQNEEGEKNNHSKFGAVIVEIRAGTGGEEAALFAADLFKMYTKYAKSQDWKTKVLDSHPTELGGFKEVIFELKDDDIYPKMKYEAGVHRVQRIPKTEKSGRIHTSTATVAILPKPKKTEIKIRPEDLKIEFYRASGPGGQYVNKKETAVRIYHLPTGLVVTSQTERNQAQNKENALSILEARLSEKIR